MVTTHRFVEAPPVLIVELDSKPAADHEMAAGMEALATIYRRYERMGQRVVSVVDMTQGQRIPASQRQIISNWMSANRPLLGAVEVAVAYIVPSAAVRSMLTAVFWVTRPPSPHSAFATREAALTWARAQAAAAGLTPVTGGAGLAGGS